MPSFNSVVTLLVLLVPVSKAFVVRPSASRCSSTTTSTFSLGPTAPNGLAYEEVTVGEGDTVLTGDVISVHYVGKFDDGGTEKVFEDSRTAKVNRGVIGATEGLPIVIPIGKGKVIEGWEQGILGDGEHIPAMKAGGSRILMVPADLAYGEEGRGDIPSNKDLTFEVELVEIGIKSSPFKDMVVMSMPAVLGFLVLNSIYLYSTGQA